MTTTRDETFARIASRVDLETLSHAFVVTVGAGSVGSVMASELVKSGVGHVALIDGDRFEPANLVRHVLGERYLWANKAEAVADHLSTFPGVDVGALNRHIDDSVTDLELDALLRPADLIIVATDDRQVQRRVARRALALDKLAVIPGLYRDGGGEVFVQLGPGHPCLLCWEAFRREDSEVRGVTALGVDALAVIQRAIYLCLALIAPDGPEARDLAPAADDPRPRQLFIQRPGANLVRVPLDHQDGCSACAVGPSPLNDSAQPRRRDATSTFLAASRRPTAQDWSFVLNTQELPEIASCAVSEPVVLEGDAVTVSWDTRHATHVEVEGVGRFLPRGETIWVPERSGVLTLRAYSPLGVDTRMTPPVRVVPHPRLPPIDIGPLGAPAQFAAPLGGITVPASGALRPPQIDLRPLIVAPLSPSSSFTRLMRRLRH